ncbi:MAG: aminotransferase class I/II-fold pyridoxal phosphate-dependent enzyme [Planctomycetales bacterium]
MGKRFLDFRSDTVTRPTPGMRKAIAEAEVGDDVFGDDPTVIRFQERVAETLGKEAALFVPSGTMSNQLAIRTQCRPGEELICESGCHIYNYEQGGAAQLSGVTCRYLEGEHGVLRLDQLQAMKRPENEHLVRTRMVALENTHNRGGGMVFPLEHVKAICGWAREQGLKTHLDGARLFNAVVASGIEAASWAEHFDTGSVCFSKGLGAPVGSALAGPRDLILEARRHRKVLGGGMRQVGILAAAALYALDNHVDRLAEDHENAQTLAAAVRDLPGLELSPQEVHTNIVIFEIDPALDTAAGFTARLEEHGVRVIAFGPTQVRICTHLDVSADDVREACRALATTVEECRSGVRSEASLNSEYAG